ncbi:MAG TPA: DUF2258 domain-containing protein [Nitrososphaeria archaeon]|nr:DUF2258 domain-containing protein [Nitrososphaeria archaeon]
MEAKNEISTGLVIAGAYADKLRRTLFAQLSSKIKSKEISAAAVARASRDLNMLLYNILVEKLAVKKGDVVRIRIRYVLEDGEIKWDYNSLSIEVYRRVGEEEVEKVLKETLTKAEEVIERKLTVREVGKTPVGDLVYSVKLGDAEVGLLEVTSLDDEILVRGALTSPEPVIIERAKLKLDGRKPVEVIEEKLREISELGRRVKREEAEEALKKLSELV